MVAGRSHRSCARKVDRGTKMLGLLLLAIGCSSVTSHSVQHPAVETWRQYIRVDTSHPNPDYSKAVEFWKEKASSVGLPIQVVQVHSGKPVVIISWHGTNASLPSIMLNHHMDVVAVKESDWKYPPFEAFIDPEGNMHGRGTQDMKSNGIMYLEAVRRLMANNITLARTVHLVAVPDEEIFGHMGMELFIETEEFKSLNIGFAIDEGTILRNGVYAVMYGDRTPRHINITCPGEGGHGSFMKNNSAGERLRKMLDYFFEFRETQRVQMNDSMENPSPSLVTINLTKLSGGLGSNILPTSLSALFDMRVGPFHDEELLNKTITGWLAETNCTHEYPGYERFSPATKLDDTNIYWTAFKKASDDLGLVLEAVVPSGSTDMRYVRRRGIPALGFTPVTDVKIRAHDSNEFLPVRSFLRGIDIFYAVIQAVANAQ